MTEFYQKRVEFFFDADIKSVQFNKLQRKLRKMKDSGQRIRSSFVRNNQQILQELSPPMSLFSQNNFEWKFSTKDQISANINQISSSQPNPISSVSLMGTFNVVQDEEMNIGGIEIPHDRGDVSLIILYPGNIPRQNYESSCKIEDKLDSKSWDNLLKKFRPQKINLHVPIFKSQSLLELNETLITLGVKNIFKETADFSGINGAKDLHISTFAQSNKILFGQKLKSQRSRLTYPARVKHIKRGKRSLMKDLSPLKSFMYVVRHNPTGLLVYIGSYDGLSKHIKQVNNKR